MKNRLVFLLSFLGLVVAGYLAYEYSKGGPITCPVGGGGCDKVRASSYSSFFGISTPLFGAAYYFFMMVTAVLLSTKWQERKLKLLQRLAAFLAVLFGVYLTYLESFVIQAYCIWCLTSFIISIAVLLLLW